jgi:hypothetical protein
MAAQLSDPYAKFAKVTLQVSFQGRNHSLPNVVTAWTIRELKQYICDRFGKNPNSTSLLFAGSPLNDDTRILSDMGIRNGSIIHIATILRGGGGYDAKEGGDERKAFLDDSVRKKQYYNQFTSLRDYANSNVNVKNINNKILVKDPHFVLTLNDLTDFGVNNNNSAAEINKLKELKSCIQNKLQNSNPILTSMRTKLGTVYAVDPSRVVITDIYYGTTNIGYVIIDYEAVGVVTLIKNAKEFEASMKSEFKSFAEMIITPPPESTDGSYAVVKSLHVSCASGKACAKWDCAEAGCRLAGLVLYMKDGQKRWKCNGRSCRMGYITVKQTSKIASSVTSNYGAIHGRVYKSVFNEEPEGIVGSGFSRSGGVWKWGSGAFNGGSTNKGAEKYHDGGYSMNTVESKWIEKAIKNWWQTGNQNTNVGESLVIFKD